ncbi:MAG: hypothetical protein IJW28_02975, partial [Clostridia bacterium]|nr:hypothetical protein [Clostridia bacterium]
IKIYLRRPTVSIDNEDLDIFSVSGRNLGQAYYFDLGSPVTLSYTKGKTYGAALMYYVNYSANKVVYDTGLVNNATTYSYQTNGSGSFSSTSVYGCSKMVVSSTKTTITNLVDNISIVLIPYAKVSLGVTQYHDTDKALVRTDTETIISKTGSGNTTYTYYPIDDTVYYFEATPSPYSRLTKLMVNSITLYSGSARVTTTSNGFGMADYLNNSSGYIKFSATFALASITVTLYSNMGFNITGGGYNHYYSASTSLNINNTNTLSFPYTSYSGSSLATTVSSTSFIIDINTSFTFDIINSSESVYYDESTNSYYYEIEGKVYRIVWSTNSSMPSITQSSSVLSYTDSYTANIGTSNSSYYIYLVEQRVVDVTNVFDTSSYYSYWYNQGQTPITYIYAYNTKANNSAYSYAPWGNSQKDYDIASVITDNSTVQLLVDYNGKLEVKSNLQGTIKNGSTLVGNITDLYSWTSTTVNGDIYKSLTNTNNTYTYSVEKVTSTYNITCSYAIETTLFSVTVINAGLISYDEEKDEHYMAPSVSLFDKNKNIIEVDGYSSFAKGGFSSKFSEDGFYIECTDIKEADSTFIFTYKTAFGNITNVQRYDTEESRYKLLSIAATTPINGWTVINQQMYYVTESSRYESNQPYNTYGYTSSKDGVFTVSFAYTSIFTVDYTPSTTYFSYNAESNAISGGNIVRTHTLNSVEVLTENTYATTYELMGESSTLVVTLTATPNTGFRMKGWSVNDVLYTSAVVGQPVGCFEFDISSDLTVFTFRASTADLAESDDVFSTNFYPFFTEQTFDSTFSIRGRGTLRIYEGYNSRFVGVTPQGSTIYRDAIWNTFAVSNAVEQTDIIYTTGYWASYKTQYIASNSNFEFMKWIDDGVDDASSSIHYNTVKNETNNVFNLICVSGAKQTVTLSTLTGNLTTADEDGGSISFSAATIENSGTIVSAGTEKTIYIKTNADYEFEYVVVTYCDSYKSFVTLDYNADNKFVNQVAEHGAITIWFTTSGSDYVLHIVCTSHLSYSGVHVEANFVEIQAEITYNTALANGNEYGVFATNGIGLKYIKWSNSGPNKGNDSFRFMHLYGLGNVNYMTSTYIESLSHSSGITSASISSLVSTSTNISATATGEQYLLITLKDIYDVYSVCFAHNTSGIYNDIYIQVSRDGTNWYTLYDAKYQSAYNESKTGKTISLSSSMFDFNTVDDCVASGTWDKNVTDQYATGNTVKNTTSSNYVYYKHIAITSGYTYTLSIVNGLNTNLTLQAYLYSKLLDTYTVVNSTYAKYVEIPEVSSDYAYLYIMVYSTSANAISSINASGIILVNDNTDSDVRVLQNAVNLAQKTIIGAKDSIDSTLLLKEDSYFKDYTLTNMSSSASSPIATLEHTLGTNSGIITANVRKYVDLV